MFLAQSREQKNAKNAPMMVERIPRQNVTKSWNKTLVRVSLVSSGSRNTVWNVACTASAVNILIIKCRKSHHRQTQQCYQKPLCPSGAFGNTAGSDGGGFCDI